MQNSKERRKMQILEETIQNKKNKSFKIQKKEKMEMKIQK
jgi:hypothetical protein